jgi:hypothetical protein
MRNKIHRQRRRETCEATGKHKYLTREEAAAGMGVLARTTSAEGLSAYRCAECAEFHVGHMPRFIRERFGM